MLLFFLHTQETIFLLLPYFFTKCWTEEGKRSGSTSLFVFMFLGFLCAADEEVALNAGRDTNIDCQARLSLYVFYNRRGISAAWWFFCWYSKVCIQKKTESKDLYTSSWIPRLEARQTMNGKAHRSWTFPDVCEIPRPKIVLKIQRKPGGEAVTGPVTSVAERVCEVGDGV